MLEAEKMELEVKSEDDALLEEVAGSDYKWGFVTDIESETFEPGLNEDVIKALSAIKGEPEWMLEFRLKAYRHLLTLTEPTWPNVSYKPVDLQAISYYSAPKKKPQLSSLDELDPEIKATYDK